MPYNNKEKQAVAARKHYLANKARIIARAKIAYLNNRKVCRDYINSVKDVPCMDCNVKLIPFAMDFDHVRGEKLFDIGKALAMSLGLPKIKEEIKKCDIVCANCHRLRTWKRYGGNEDIG